MRYRIYLFLALLVGVSLMAQTPPNDDFNNATTISALPFTENFNIAGATQVAIDWNLYCGYGPTVWYSFTPTRSMVLGVDTVGSTYDTTLLVATGTADNLTQLVCNDDYYGSQSAVALSVVAGTTYYIRIAASYNFTDPNLDTVFNVYELSPPANDGVDNGAAITTLPYSTAENLRAATSGIDDPYCYGSVNTVWFAYTPIEDTYLMASTNTPTNLGVYTRTGGAFTELGCNYDGGMVFKATGGVTYYFMLGSNPWVSFVGDATFTLQTSPPPLALTIKMDQFNSVVPGTGAVTIRGTVECSREASYAISGDLIQNIGQSSVQGSISVYGDCNPGTPNPWSAQLNLSPGFQLHAGRSVAMFRSGKATLTLIVNGFDWVTGSFAVSNVGGVTTLRAGQK